MTTLVIDCNYLGRRAFFSARGRLSHHEVRTGVIFGIFKDLISLQNEFRTTRVVLCFDCGKGIRKEIYPGYKAKRHSKKNEETDPQKLEAEDEYQKQMYLLRTKYLRRVGYANVLYEEGLESDDIMASVANTVVEEGGDVVMVTEDRDMYQTLGPKVMMYAPNKHHRMTLNNVWDEWGIDPRLWWKVLTLAGCDTDEVPGVSGVAKKTAIKYLTKQLKKDSVKYKAIRDFIGTPEFKRNIRLVKLPIKGTPTYTIRENRMDPEGWKEVADKLGMRSIRDQMPLPVALRTRRKGLFDK